MRIVRLRLSNVRKLRSVDLVPGDDLNILFGNNGSGKTSLLEAIHLLGYGRSFRTRRISEVVSQGESTVRVYGEVRSSAGNTSKIGIEKVGRRTRVRVDGADIGSTSILARLLPAVFVGPECGRLLEEAELRRRVLNWVMFHVEPRYLEFYQRFNRALRQRNAALREGADGSVLGAWDEQLVTPALALESLRGEHVPAITEFAADFLSTLLPMEFSVEYRRGWEEGTDLSAVLSDSRVSDRRLGYTSRGPHRADLVLRTRGVAARTMVSRGEGKLLAMGLQLAQAAYFGRVCGEPPVVLVDDLGTELDEGNYRKLMAALGSIGAQSFVTTVQVDSGPHGGSLGDGGIRDGDRHSLFHVEQGEVAPVL